MERVLSLTGETRPSLSRCNDPTRVTVRSTGAIYTDTMKLPQVLPAGVRPSVALAPWAPFFLRVIVGYGCMEHGYAKIARGPQHFAGILVAIGVPEPHLMSWLTILVEMVGGLAVLLGVCAPVVTVPMAAILVVAALTVHFPYGF